MKNISQYIQETVFDTDELELISSPRGIFWQKYMAESLAVVQWYKKNVRDKEEILREADNFFDIKSTMIKNGMLTFKGPFTNTLSFAPRTNDLQNYVGSLKGICLPTCPILISKDPSTTDVVLFNATSKTNIPVFDDSWFGKKIETSCIHIHADLIKNVDIKILPKGAVFGINFITNKISNVSITMRTSSKLEEKKIIGEFIGFPVFENVKTKGATIVEVDVRNDSVLTSQVLNKLILPYDHANVMGLINSEAFDDNSRYAEYAKTFYTINKVTLKDIGLDIKGNDLKFIKLQLGPYTLLFARDAVDNDIMDTLNLSRINITHINNLIKRGDLQTSDGWTVIFGFIMN